VFAASVEPFFDSIDPLQTLAAGSADGKTCRDKERIYCAFIPATRITLAHFSVACAMNWPNSLRESSQS